MSNNKETAKKGEGALPPICPLRLIAFQHITKDATDSYARCILDRCAWWEICINLTRLGREHHEY